MAMMAIRYSLWWPQYTYQRVGRIYRARYVILWSIIQFEVNCHPEQVSCGLIYVFKFYETREGVTCPLGIQRYIPREPSIDGSNK